jgi:hypothetical protein
MGERTNMGHRWVHDDDRVECMYCLCSPLDSAAKAVCPEVNVSIAAEAAVRRLAESRRAKTLVTSEEPLPQPEDE